MGFEKISPNVAVAVVLAAGGGTRFRGETHKLDAIIDGRSVIQHAVGAALDAGFEHVIVVAGAVAIDAAPGAMVVHNERWAQGQATSLQAGVAAAAALGAEAVVVGLGDQPFIAPASWRAVVFDPHPIAVATYGGQRGNPVKLHRSVWPLLPRERRPGST